MTSDTEAYQKVSKLRQLSDAIHRVQLSDLKGYERAAKIQNLLMQREAVRKTLPPLRLVWSNPQT